MRLALAVALLASCTQSLELLPGAPTPGALGDACGACVSGLSCYSGTTPTNADFPGGMCSRACTAAADCPGGDCVTFEATSLCAASCNPSAGVTCRAGYACCANQQVVTGAGTCVPTGSGICGG